MAHITKHVTQLPEDILENQTCTVCKKYLSYPPAKTYFTGEIKCGRCSEENDFGVVSSFDKLAAHIMFPCVNRYEGCGSLLEYEAVPDHEKNCKEGLYHCPFCPEAIYNQKSVLNLIDHFWKLHKKRLLNNLVIQAKKYDVQYFIHRNSHINLICLISMFHDNDSLSINVATVGQNPSRIQYQAKLFEYYPGKVLSTSPYQPCSSWHSGHRESIVIQLNNDLPFISVELLFKISAQSINWNHAIVPQSNLLEIHQSKKTLKPGNMDLQKWRQVNPDFKGTFPRFYLEGLEDKDLKEKLRNPIFSSCGKYIVDDSGKILMDIQCSFCENYFPLLCSFTYKCSKGCSFSICKFCRRGDRNFRFGQCSLCHSPLTSVQDLCCGLDYYCRFGCNKLFKESEICRHEDYCDNNNSPIFEPEPEFIAKYFGSHFLPWSNLCRNNLFFMDCEIFKDEPGFIYRLYIVDKRGFQYMLDSKTLSSGKGVNFLIHHEYDPSKYFVIINIMRDNKFTRLVNCQSFQLEFNPKNRFAIIVKERD